MPRPREVRTFICLDRREVEFVKALQRLVQRKSGRKRLPPLHSVIQGALLDYKRVLELGSMPNFLRAYDQAKAYSRRSCSAPNEAW